MIENAGKEGKQLKRRKPLTYNDQLFLQYLKEVVSKSRLSSAKKDRQHGGTSVFLHSVAVAYFSYRAACLLRMRGHVEELIRGALLHDYFLYDWHKHKSQYKMHGFSHPNAALKNAESDFLISHLERDIIRNHMFPLTLRPPRHKESYIVCIADKVCAVYEFFKKQSYPVLKSRLREYAI